RLETLAGLLAHVSEVRVTGNLAGARWSKLAMNAAGSALSTVSGVPLGQAVKRRVVRQLSTEIFTELVLVSRALGVTLEPVAKGVDLNFFALVDGEGRRRGRLACELRLPLSFAVGMRYRRVKSSMLRALERGQDPGIEMLNGEIVDRGAALGIPTPVNAEVVRAIQDVLAGEAELGPRLVDRVAERSGLRARWQGGRSGAE
ncbi:MAG: 2-dehydropantoate 2-reductase, partial [Alphaproteobacteria bacterium]|nr:2-dehydropantoate 2-reductase [Alphaproteobacteria bacterium]